MTRGEPRPVHITLIATCRVYNSRRVIRGIQVTLGLPPETTTSTKPDGSSFSLAGPGRGLSCASAGPEAHRDLKSSKLGSNGGLRVSAGTVTVTT